MVNIKPIKVRSDELQRKIKEIALKTDLNVRDIMRNEAKLLVEELVDRTKPRSMGRLKKRIDSTYRRVFIASTKGDTSIDGSARQSLYKAQKDKRYKKVPRIGIVGPALTKAIKTAQSHCGFFAAGWLGRGNPLGAKRGVPNYVRRQDIQGKVSETGHYDNITIKGENLVQFIRHFPKIRRAEQNLLYAALGTRIYKIDLRLKRIMQGKARYTVPKK